MGLLLDSFKDYNATLTDAVELYDSFLQDRKSETIVNYITELRKINPKYDYTIFESELLEVIGYMYYTKRDGNTVKDSSNISSFTKNKKMSAISEQEVLSFTETYIIVMQAYKYLYNRKSMLISVKYMMDAWRETFGEEYNSYHSSRMLKAYLKLVPEDSTMTHSINKSNYTSMEYSFATNILYMLIMRLQALAKDDKFTNLIKSLYKYSSECRNMIQDTCDSKEILDYKETSNAEDLLNIRPISSVLPEGIIPLQTIMINMLPFYGSKILSITINIVVKNLKAQYSGQKNKDLLEDWSKCMKSYFFIFNYEDRKDDIGNFSSDIIYPICILKEINSILINDVNSRLVYSLLEDIYNRSIIILRKKDKEYSRIIDGIISAVKTTRGMKSVN